MVLQRMKIISFITLGLYFSSAFSEVAEECRPEVNEKVSQYIIGYGSLLWEKSKGSLQLGPNQPVEIKDFARRWLQYGQGKENTNTTYLGVIPSKNGRINAAYARVENLQDLAELDRRESIHCRMQVPRKNIQSLTKTPVPKGQYWIYTSEDVNNHPNEIYPILQTYLDNFLSGCFELEEKYHVENFALNCIQTTGFWSKNILDDRVAPKTPFADSTYVYRIDELLAKMLP